MIKIGRPEKDYYTCQSCNSNYSVNKITIGLHESSTSSFRICDHCLMKMGDIKVLEVMELNKKLQEQNKTMREALEYIVQKTNEPKIEVSAYEALAKIDKQGEG